MQRDRTANNFVILTHSHCLHLSC